MQEAVKNFLEEIKIEIETIGENAIPSDKKDVILGVGNIPSPIVFISDDPNIYENEEGIVEAMSAGEFLFKLLDIEDINSNQYYVTTLSKRKIRYSTFNSDDKNKLKEILFMQLSLINPKIIVLLGVEVFNVFFENENFDALRGKYFDWKADTKLLISYDIETVMKARLDEGRKSIVASNFWSDLKSLKKYLNN